MPALHDEISGWVHANPILVVIVVLGVALAIFRLARRGRWPVIVAMVAGWAVMLAAGAWWLR